MVNEMQSTKCNQSNRNIAVIGSGSAFGFSLGPLISWTFPNRPVVRARIAQAFGRLIRRGDDKGVFLMLDAATPTRLFASLPPGTEVQRMGLADAVETVRTFLAD